MCANVLGVLSHSLARAASPITFPHLGVADLPKLKSIFFYIFTSLHFTFLHIYIFTFSHVYILHFDYIPTLQR